MGPAQHREGDRTHIELATAADIPVEADAEKSRSWFGITDVVAVREGAEPPQDEIAEYAAPLFEAAVAATPESADALAALYGSVLSQSITHWRDGTITDAEARLLDYFVRTGLLTDRHDSLPAVAPLLAKYRQLESGIAVPTRSPGVVEAELIDQPLFVRGNHRQPAEPVRRRFLECWTVCLTTPATAAGLRWPRSTRCRQPAHHASHRQSPLAPHLWSGTGHHDRQLRPSRRDPLAPTAARLPGDAVGRRRLFAQTDDPPVGHVRDVPAEWRGHAGGPRGGRRQSPAVADAGPTTRSRGDPRQLARDVGRTRYHAIWPTGERRHALRSVYVASRRNTPTPLLAAFDAPVPYTTTVRRSATNVPAQSLALMNDPFVIGRAAAWSRRILDDETIGSTAQRVARMYHEAFARRPNDADLTAAVTYLGEAALRWQATHDGIGRLTAEIADGREQVRSLEAATRALLADSAAPWPDVDPPEPIARWEFAEDVSDDLGTLDAEIIGSAQVADGRLVLDGNGDHVATEPLDREIVAKTLEAVG